MREYIWLPETEIAPTMQSRTQVDRPIAVVDGVNTASPATLMVHVDHLNRPVRMTNSTKASVWDVIYTPWGAFHSATGAQTLNARFPGQWFQLESGLHYNWHRHYDPSLGRYTQPDPLGFVDGPSVYAYAKSSPHTVTDSEGLISGLNQSRPPSAVQQCGWKDWCKEQIKNQKNIKGKAKAIVIACLALLGNEDGPSPPPPPPKEGPKIEGPSKPGPPPPPKDPPPAPGSTHDTGSSTLP